MSVEATLSFAAVTAPVFAAKVKLPDFCLHDPADPVPACRGSVSSARHTKYFHVVTALDSATTRRLMGPPRHPPQADKYAALKKELLQLYKLSDMERADRLLSLTGLGDSRPSELMENMLALLGSGDTSFLFTHLFLRQLPPPVRTVLANSPLIRTKDYRGLAEEADRLLLASRQF